MARKYDLMTELYDRTAKVISGNPESWQAFLRSACNNFKLRFDEQLLIYAQRPDATAVLEIERWNGSFGRWVNRGARGIAVFEDVDRSRQRLIHYFDISDTHASRYSRPVPIWQMKPEYAEEIIDTLESTFGELESKDTLENAVLSAAKNAVTDNLVDYCDDLMGILNDSFLEGMGEDYVRTTYRRLVTNSVAYMIMTRLGLDTGEYFDADDFRDVTEFNTPEVLNALGIATSDIAEMGLTEISRTITALDRQNRIIAGKGNSEYNRRNQNERSSEYGRTGIYEDGRLQSSEPDNAGAAGSGSRQMGADETEISSGTPQNPVLQPADELQADGAFSGSGTAGDQNGGNLSPSDVGERGADRGIEGDGYDEMGSPYEQSEELGTGNRESGGNLRLEWYDRSHEDRSLPFFGGDETINEILSTTPHLSASKEEIRAFYEANADNEARTSFIKDSFNNDVTELTLADGRQVGYRKMENVLHLWEGSYESRTKQSFYDWGVIAQHFEAMRLLGQLQDTMKPLPSIDGQFTFMFEAEEKQSSAFTFSQEIIDAVLTRGSGVSEGKLRIYEQFQKSLSAKENADFLKNEYGVGGSYPVIVGAGIDEQHDTKGIRLSKGIGNDKPHIDLKWTQVEKRIGELIRMDRYLNPKEKERYPEWLERQEERRREQQERNAVREALSVAPPEKEETKDEPEHYEYHLGDKVYLGASEYEILSFDEERVMLYDTAFPLFQKEETRADFDRKVQENPLNDHLKVKGLAPEERMEIDPNTTPIGDDDYYFNRPGMGEFEAIYYNPDATAGGQFVVLHLSYELIAEAKENSNSVGGFYEYLDSKAYTELIDFGTQEFDDYLDAYAEPSPDFIGRNEKTMQALISQAESELNSENPLLEQAKQLIDEFCREEYEREEGADYSDLSNVEIAYTTTEDDQHEIQAAVNLEAFCINTYVDGKTVRTEQYDSLEQLIENGLSALSFEDLVYVSEDELAPFYEKEEPVKPAWEQKRTRVQTFDLHPDIPMSERNTFDLASHEVEEAGKKERFRRNLMAIQLLKKCQDENRFATPEEQEILSKYVGWGGIPEAFDENNPSWGTEYLELSVVLTPDEYESAKESVLTAFYTPPVVIQGIYKAMERMGFRGGNILEPSCGIGNFIGMLPQSMQEAKMYGVEIDKISAGIAQQLYQRTSIAALAYEEANIPDSFFDAVVGNVPFGDIRLADKRYDKYHFLIHDYFFAKSLDKLRPGGVMALVTSKGTMDKENPAIRKYIAQRAELLGAIRLPNNTFKGNAGTEVVSDILILQKRDRLIDIEPDWVHLETDGNGRKMNSYFVQHPEMVLGEWKTVSGRFGNEDTVVPFEGAELSELLDDAISNIHGEITEYEIDEELTEEDDSIPADPDVRNFSYTVYDDKIYYRENSRMTPVEVSATAENRIKGMIQIRDCVRLLLEMQTEDYPDEEIKAEQQRLNNRYDDFTKKYGLISSRANVSAFSQDSSFSLLSALEVLDEEGNLERKADMFFKRTIKPHTPVTSVDTASEALAVSLGEKACVDMEYMCALSGKPEQEIFTDLKGVIFLNPMYGYGNSTEPKYLMADEYLSGNVREKLTVAKRSAEVYPEDYQTNVEALEKVQPTDLTASEIYVRLGATWLPPEIVEQFMFELLGTPRYSQWNIKVHYSQFTSEWNIEGKSYDRGNVKAYSTYGSSRINAYKIIEETLNLKDVRIFDYIEDDEGKKKAVLNAKETAIAQAKQEQIKQAFQDWVWADPQRREKLCKLYNEKFNSIRPREYDGSHITFSGMNPEIELREHQRNAVAHILYGGNTLLAHAVGAGKTYEMVAAAMESKRLGLCNKSLFVVPNHLTEQWAAEFLQLYPAANILVATKKDFETKNRKRFCGRIATGDYDAVIIGHSQFEKIPMSIERQRAILERELNEIVDGIAELKRNRGENFSVKQLQKSKKSIETKLKKLNADYRIIIA